ncbi:MAG: monovalent cation/H(+) antiporter subunit G [Pseudomonadota bacterium]|nr:monovalent cation/H(+) antiporter subunit G [Pseudomonadota bacterium]
MIDLSFWPILRDVLSWALFLIGSASVITGAIGIVRFPDFYTRMHAAGITDTAGAELMIFAMMLQAPSWLIVAKLAFIGVFLFFTSPVSTHALAHAAHLSGLNPLLGPELKREGEQ